jgi:hypothetical protein
VHPTYARPPPPPFVVAGPLRQPHAVDISGPSCGGYCWLHGVQGKSCTLGSFTNPIDAAKCYDKEAARIPGARAILNFTPGCSPPSSLLQGGRACGQKVPEANSLLPPGTAGGGPAAVPGVPTTERNAPDVSSAPCVEIIGFLVVSAHRSPMNDC